MGSYTFDDYRKDHVDGKIKDNNGDPRHGGGNNKPDATLDELGGIGAKVEAAPVVLENFDGMDYETIRNRLMNVSENIAPGYNDTLRGVAQQIVKGASDLQHRLETLESDGGWKGKTHDAALANLEKSGAVPEELRKGATALGVLSEYFSQVMSTNKHNILDQWDIYQECLRDYSSETDTVKQYFNNFARDVMKNYYSPQINDIASHQPAVDSEATPEVGDPSGGDDNNSGDNSGDNDGENGGNNGGANNGGGNHGGANNGGGNNGGGGNSGSGNSGGNTPPPPPAFSPPDLNAENPGGGSGGGGSPTGGNSEGADTPKQSFNPPELNIPKPSSESGDVPGGSPTGTDKPGGGPPVLPGLGANLPKPPGLDGLDDPSLPGGAPGAGAAFDPSKVFDDPKSIEAAKKLLADPKTADAAKKIFSDPKLAEAAKTLFGDRSKGLLGNPKALDAAATLFGDPEAAEAAKVLFGDPETAKAAQQLLDDPRLSDLSKGLRDAGVVPETQLPQPDSTDSREATDVGRSLLGQAGVNNAAAGLPGVGAGAGGSDGLGGLIGAVFDGVNQIVQTAQQGAHPQPAGFGGGPGVDGPAGGPTDRAGGPGAGHGGGGGGAAGPGKLHLAGAGAPVAANFATAAHPFAMSSAVDPAQSGSGGGAPMGGGGAGSGGKGGEGKEHKGNKALRGSQQGQDLIGQPDAVVSVIGEDGDAAGPGWSVDT
ncbi:hypothetical protein BCA37_24505 [Mycobacterium sp. djl-10]|nr:hypothetical protein BCA37_24505 [Mycobacterium sp. djl-10]